MLFQHSPDLAEVRNGAGKAIQTIDNDSGDLPGLHRFHQLLEGRAVGVLAGEPLVVKDEGFITGIAFAILDLRLDGDAILLFHGLAGVNGVHDRASLTSLPHGNAYGAHRGACGAGQEKAQAFAMKCSMICRLSMLVVKMMYDSHGSILLQGNNM